MKSTCKKFLSVIVILVVQSSCATKVINIGTIGKKNLNLQKGFSLSIVDFGEYQLEGHRGWKSKILIKKGDKVIGEKYPIMSEEDETCDFFFVPIKKGKFLIDLNDDKNYEFAVALFHGGNAASTGVTVFSLKEGGKLKVYKKAWYAQEFGQEVIWDYKNAPKRLKL